MFWRHFFADLRIDEINCLEELSHNNLCALPGNHYIHYKNVIVIFNLNVVISIAAIELFTVALDEW